LVIVILLFALVVLLAVYFSCSSYRLLYPFFLPFVLVVLFAGVLVVLFVIPFRGFSVQTVCFSTSFCSFEIFTLVVDPVVLTVNHLFVASWLKKSVSCKKYGESTAGSIKWYVYSTVEV